MGFSEGAKRVGEERVLDERNGERESEEWVFLLAVWIMKEKKSGEREDGKIGGERKEESFSWCVGGVLNIFEKIN